LKSIVGIEIVVVVQEVRSISSIMLSPSQNPNVCFLDAVIASMSVPIMFSPVRIRGIHHSLWFSDGGVMSNFPWKAFPSKRCIGFRVSCASKKPCILKDLEEEAQMSDTLSDAPGMHVIGICLQKSFMKSICVKEDEMYLKKSSLGSHVINLLSDSGPFDVSTLNSKHMNLMFHRGIMLAYIHYLAVTSEECMELDYSLWRSLTACFFSLYIRNARIILLSLIKKCL
jgi:hypothetical protein